MKRAPRGGGGEVSQSPILSKKAVKGVKVPGVGGEGGGGGGGYNDEAVLSKFPLMCGGRLGASPGTLVLLRGQDLGMLAVKHYKVST